MDKYLVASEVNARFDPPEEYLAFKASLPGEADLPELWHEPLEVNKDFLTAFKDMDESIPFVPDIELLNIGKDLK